MSEGDLQRVISQGVRTGGRGARILRLGSGARDVDVVLDRLADAIAEPVSDEGTTSRSLIGLTRREFFKLPAVVALGVTLAACTKEQLDAFFEKIKNRPVRRDISSMSSTDPDLVAYKAAITAMQNLPSSDKRNWTNQALIHQNFCPHGNWLFLPWHRAYLYFFEEICREMSGKTDFALPYWNWSKDNAMPSAFTGGSSNPLFHPGRNSSPTASPAIVGPPRIETILDETSFLLFASGQISGTVDQRTSASYGPLEGGPHNHIHGVIGGDMGTYMSPLDPIFWTHHNMIECIWVEWNFKRGNPNTNDPNWTGRTFTEFCDRMGNPVSVSVPEMLLYPLLLYRFDDPILGVP